MLSVKIPAEVQVGGFKFEVVMNRVGDEELNAEQWKASFSRERGKIIIRQDLAAPEISLAFIHECLHPIDEIYCNKHIGEANIGRIAYGLHQVLEQLGVRFVK